MGWRRNCSRLGVNVIVEFGSWARAERDVLREGGRALGAAVELRYLDAPLDELYRRVTERGGMDPPMTRANFDEWAAIIEVPTPTSSPCSTTDHLRWSILNYSVP